MRKFHLLYLFLVCLFEKQITATYSAQLSLPELAINQAKKNIQKYMDFEEDYLDFAQKKSRSTDTNYFYNIGEISHNISDIKEESDFVNGLQANEKTIYPSSIKKSGFLRKV